MKDLFELLKLASQPIVFMIKYFIMIASVVSVFWFLFWVLDKLIDLIDCLNGC
tara:strand:+ start:1252 stop:1410 length:159 start_codon:yes stop_codon:yes gene_type:complete